MIYLNLCETPEYLMPEEILKNIIYKIKKKTGTLYINNYEDKVLISLSEINKKTLQKLEKYIKINCVKRVCLDDTLIKNEDVLLLMEGQDVSILNGEWLFDYVIKFIINYIVENKNEKMEIQEISILTKNINEVLVDFIREISSQAKLINIITTNESKFKRIERELYEKKGILLNINNNYKKSLLKSDIIVNLDFSEEEFNEYNLPKKACIIHKNGNVKIEQKGFEGVSVTGYEMSMPKKYIKYLMYFKDFNNILLYESFIYKKTNSKNIYKELLEDNFHILSLKGQNGKIRKTEFKNLNKSVN